MRQHTMRGFGCKQKEADRWRYLRSPNNNQAHGPWAGGLHTAPYTVLCSDSNYPPPPLSVLLVSIPRGGGGGRLHGS